EADRRGLARDAEVACEGEACAGAGGGPVHGCDDRLRHAIDEGDDPRAGADELGEALAVPLGRQLRHDAYVASGRKGAAHAGDDHAPYGFVGLQLVEPGLDVLPHGAGKGVESLRAVDAHPADVAVSFDQDAVLLRCDTVGLAHLIPSTIVAIPCPTPMHMVARP